MDMKKNPCEDCPIYPQKQEMINRGYIGMPYNCLPGVCSRQFLFTEEEGNEPQSESTT